MRDAFFLLHLDWGILQPVLRHLNVWVALLRIRACTTLQRLCLAGSLLQLGLRVGSMSPMFAVGSVGVLSSSYRLAAEQHPEERMATSSGMYWLYSVLFRDRDQKIELGSRKNKLGSKKLN